MYIYMYIHRHIQTPIYILQVIAFVSCLHLLDGFKTQMSSIFKKFESSEFYFVAHDLVLSLKFHC